MPRQLASKCPKNKLHSKPGPKPLERKSTRTPPSMLLSLNCLQHTLSVLDLPSTSLYSIMRLCIVLIAHAISLLTIIPFRRCCCRSFPPLTHLGHTKGLLRPPPLHRVAQKSTTRLVPNFREAFTKVEWVVGTSKQPYTTRIRCRMPAHHTILRALMRCFRSCNDNHSRAAIPALSTRSRDAPFEFILIG